VVKASDIYYIQLTSPIPMVIFLLSMLGIIASLFTMGLVFKTRETPIIKSSSPLFCILILVGIILGYLFFTPYLGIPEIVNCVTPPILGPLSFSIIFGYIF